MSDLYKRFILFSLLTLIGLGCLSPAASYALDLKEAKTAGLVGEKIDGYVDVVKSSASQEVKKLVAEINRKRKKKYQEIAKRNGTKLQAVEALAGKKAIEKTQSGHFIKPASGKWEKKN